MSDKNDIDVKKLLAGVEFNPDDVVTAAARNAVFFVDAAQFRLACMEKRAAAKLAHERVEAETSLAVRKYHKDLGDKITEGTVDATVLLTPAVKSAAEALSKADVYDEYSKLIVEVFRMRRDCLRIVDDMTRGEMAAQSAIEAGSEKMRGQREELRKRFPGGA